eukprot:scaffold21269_cov60-Phaeocystis_antarctica.AAC.3
MAARVYGNPGMVGEKPSLGIGRHAYTSVRPGMSEVHWHSGGHREGGAVWRSYPEQEDAADRGGSRTRSRRRGEGGVDKDHARRINGGRAGKQGSEGGTQGTSRGRDGGERGHREEDARIGAAGRGGTLDGRVEEGGQGGGERKGG